MDEAEKQCQEAIKIDPQHHEVHNTLGNVLFQKHDYKAAIAEYRTALKIDSNDTRTHMNLGNALDKNGDTDSAIEEYNKAIELEPTNANAHLLLAISLAKKHYADSNAALDACRTAESLSHDTGISQLCASVTSVR